jgi:peptidoglycan/LPS O-acetylase OafA/YrhL
MLIKLLLIGTPRHKVRLMSQNQPFRKDINGLRAYAVMGVVLYHFGLAGFTGGFAGVDIFFVISGFLMTGIILSGLEKGKFSLTSFYLSRARRIIPALAVLCVGLLIFGYFWLIPSDYQALGRHAASAITFVSNFIFKGEAGYFDAPARDKWLLHTWSLSVEWQFYLLYPLFLLALQKYKKPFLPALAILGLLSLALSGFATPLKSSFSFYLLPTRIWEFMAGGIAFVLSRQKNPPLKNMAAMYFFGMILIVASFPIFNDDTLWPGIACIIPVLGTVFVILSARNDAFLTGNVPAEWIGKTSYSIYLWHWPVFVGLGYFGHGNLALAGIIASFALGFISYALVETPTRVKMNWKNAAGAVVLIALAGCAVMAARGLPGRVSTAINAMDRAADNRYETDKNCGFKNGHIKRCPVGKAGEVRFVVWGDSHAGVIAEPVAEAAKGGGLVYTLGCPTIFNANIRTKAKAPCPAFNEAVLADIQTLPKTTPVILINRFSYYLLGFNEGIRKRHGLDYSDVPPATLEKDEAGLFKTRLTESLCRIAKTRKLYVVQPIAEMGHDVPKTVARHMMTGRPLPELAVTRAEYMARHKVVLEALSGAHKSCGVNLLDPLPYLCEQGTCRGLKDGRPLYFDDDHLSTWGSSFLVPMFAKVF